VTRDDAARKSFVSIQSPLRQQLKEPRYIANRNLYQRSSFFNNFWNTNTVEESTMNGEQLQRKLQNSVDVMLNTIDIERVRPQQVSK
jgi:hypothetical protein